MNATRLDIGELKKIRPKSQRVRIYFRNVFIPDTGDPDPLYPNPEMTRWSTDAGTFYAATIEPATWAEYCRSNSNSVELADPTGGFGLTNENFDSFREQRVGDPLDPRVMYTATLEFDRLVNLSDPLTQTAIRRAGFDLNDLQADDFGACPTLAGDGEDLGWQAILAPSAAWRFSGSCTLAVFDCCRPTHKNLKADRVDLPTVAVAYLTQYRAGERPGWLTLV